jgi:Tfp pilus assembly protein PilN
VIAKLNLASQPFRNRTFPWAVAVLISLVSVVALVLIFSEYRRVRAESDAAERQVLALRGERAQLEKQAAAIRQNIPPEQRQTLEAAHALVERKSFSWSQLFADLEGLMPSSVRVSRINVREVSRRGEQTTADLDLTVVGRLPNDVLGMMTEMNRAGTFHAVPVTENQRTGKGESGFEWVLRVSYVQRARTRADDSEGDAAATRPAGESVAEARGRD